ncbi:MAG: sugar transporter, partial [Acidobacteria bacterium]
DPPATPAKATPTQATPATTTVTPAETMYRIQIGDELEIKSYYNPELNDKVLVRPDGRISLQLIKEIQAEGRTPEDLSNALTQQYGTQFRQPEMTVILTGFGGQRAYISGEVTKPSIITLTTQTTVLQAIAVAEGFKETAREDEVLLIRRSPDRTPQYLTLNLKDALKGKDLKQDMLLQPYDIVYVPPSRITNVNRFVDQYIRKNVPIPFTLTYRIDTPSGTAN